MRDRLSQYVLGTIKFRSKACKLKTLRPRTNKLASVDFNLRFFLAVKIQHELVPFVNN